MSIATTRLWNALEIATQQLRLEEVVYRARAQRALKGVDAAAHTEAAERLNEKASYFERVLAATKTEAGQ